MQPTVRVGQAQVVQMGAPGAPRVVQMGTPMPQQGTAQAVYTAAPRIVQQGPTVVQQGQTLLQQGQTVVQQGQTVVQQGTTVATSSVAMPPGAARMVMTQGGVPTYTTTSAPSPYPTVIRAGGGVPVSSMGSAIGSTVRTVVAPQATQVLQSGQSRPHTLAGPVYTQGAYETKHQDDPQLQNLKELRSTSGLKHVPVSDGLLTLKAGATDGKLSREEFLVAYETLLATHNVDLPTSEVQNAVFDLFDRDDNNVVDMMELICGISLLCSGSEDDKIHAVFNVFDENGDGFISMDEMFKFLTSVFKVVLTPNVMGVLNTMGVTVESPEDLASVTALECFKTADLNHDGKLSVVEFKNWFYAPRNDPAFLLSPVRKLLQ